MRPGERWLLAGAALGALLAVSGLRLPAPGVPAGVAAMVGDVPIPTEAHADALAALEADRPGSAEDPVARQAVLDRLIDEAILVGEGVSMGLPSSDPRARALLATAVLDLWAAEAAATAPSEAELAAFAVAEGAGLRGPERLSVSVVWEDSTGAATPAPLPIPGSALPPDRLAELLGQRVVTAVQDLEVGGQTGPLPSAGAWVRVRLEARSPGAAPSPEVVQAAWRTAQQEAFVRARLDARRDAAGVRLAPGAP